MAEKTSTIKQWFEEEYNEYMAVYDYGDRVRVTNGSAGHYVDVSPFGNSFRLEGERYGESIKDSCDADRESLMEKMSHTI